MLLCAAVCCCVLLCAAVCCCVVAVCCCAAVVFCCVDAVICMHGNGAVSNSTHISYMCCENRSSAMIVGATPFKSTVASKELAELIRRNLEFIQVSPPCLLPVRATRALVSTVLFP